MVEPMVYVTFFLQMALLLGFFVLVFCFARAILRMFLSRKDVSPSPGQ